MIVGAKTKIFNHLNVIETFSYSHGKTRIVVDTSSNMVVVLFHDRIALLVMRHLRPKTLLKAGKVNFLGFYIVDFKGLSYHTHGLLGMAYIFISVLQSRNIIVFDS